MKLLSVFSLFLVFLAFIGVVHRKSPGKIDYYYLVLQWPQSFCNTGKGHCRSNIPTNFTIHGLWLQNQPRNHVGPPFNASLIYKNKVLLKKLNEFWPNLKKAKKNEVFWEHEWDEHGRYTNFKQNDYFDRTVALANKVVVNLTGALLGGDTYKFEEIKNAIKKATKFVPRLECTVDKNGKLQLLQVMFRVKIEKDAENFLDCNSIDKCCFNYSKIAFPKTTVSTSPRDYKIALPNPTVYTSTHDEL